MIRLKVDVNSSYPKPSVCDRNKTCKDQKEVFTPSL